MTGDGCDCAGCREWAAVHARVSREVPYGERIAQREQDKRWLRWVEDMGAAGATLPSGRGVA